MTVRIATWNVNSIRARMDSVTRWMEENSPDVMCLQELKVEEEAFPGDVFEGMGYAVALNAQKTWNGVATMSRHPLEEVRRGFSSGFLGEQKRLLTVRTAGITVANAYVPQGGDPSLPRFRDKLGFLEELSTEFGGFVDSGKPLLLAGDMNVAPGDDDVFDPVELSGLVGFHPEERKRIRALMERGFVDLLRTFRPSGKVYSWWDYRGAAFRRDRGMRLDLMLASGPLAAKALDCAVDPAPRKWTKPSDHVPVLATFDLSRRED
ncbi:exodeoxyribonuclease III [Candidatus Fermentibacterales bacterium]|nr:exodeoxyribonuclease III [Candidatus Fermentibacterales bacterium]